MREAAPSVSGRMPRLVTLGVAVLLASCSSDAPLGDSSGPPSLPDIPGLVISDPFPAQGGPGELAWVSLQEGVAPGGFSATVRSAGGGILTSPVINGGFDPAPLQVTLGDTITVSVEDPSGLVMVSWQAQAKANAPPVIVRVSPTPRMRDVPLNMSLLVVFSEPVDPATVTDQTVRLFKGGVSVAGEVELDPEGIRVTFLPAVALDPNTDYSLDVTTGVKDLSGEALAEPSQIPFTTGPTPSGFLRIVSTTTGSPIDPDGYRVIVDHDTAGAPVVQASDSLTLVAAVGPHTVSLTGVAANCTVVPPLAVLVSVTAGDTAVVAFMVDCVPPGTLVFVRNDQVYLVNSDGTGLVQLTNTGAGVSNSDPAWSPDGQRLAFASNRGGSWAIYIMDADGSNVVQRTSGGSDNQPTWSPDGQQLAFTGLNPIGTSTSGSGSWDVYVMSADDDGTSPIDVTDDQGQELYPAWSPDGTRVAFVSDRTAFDFAADVYTTSLDGTQVSQLTNGFGFPPVQFHQPAWSPDGQLLAVVTCLQGPYTDCTVSPVTVSVMNSDGSGLRVLAQAGGPASPTWSPDGQVIAFAGYGCSACQPSLRFIRADGTDEGLILSNGHSPAWRPLQP